MFIKNSGLTRISGGTDSHSNPACVGEHIVASAALAASSSAVPVAVAAGSAVAAASATASPTPADSFALRASSVAS